MCVVPIIRPRRGCPEGARKLSPGLNDTKLRAFGMFYCAEGAEEFSQVATPISARIRRGASMGEWLLSRRDSTIVARHEVPGIMRKIGPSQRDD